MPDDQAKLDDVQRAFLDASTKREVPCKVNITDGEEVKEVTVTIRRWSFSQQINLGPSLTKIISHFLSQLPNLMGDGMKEGSEIKIDVTTLCAASYNMGTVMEALLPDIQKVLIGSLAHNFANDLTKTSAFVESLEDLAEGLELLLLIGSLNVLRDTAKKKYSSLASLFQSAAS